MSALDLGQAYAASWTATQSGTTVLTVTLPDGTTATPTVNDDSAPIYTATVATPQAGRYLLTWVQDSNDDVYTDVINVWPADPRFIVPLDEMISALRATNATESDREDMRLMLAAATEVIEDIVGAVLVRTVTQTADGGKTGIALYERPTEVNSVTIDGTLQVEDTDYVVDLDAGIVYCGAATSPGWFSPGRQNVTIVYTTGQEVVPPSIRLATVELVRHMWQIGRQGNNRAILPGDTSTSTPTSSGYLVPNRVMELCLPYKRTDTFG